jgi:hypothetical protein
MKGKILRFGRGFVFLATFTRLLLGSYSSSSSLDVLSLKLYSLVYVTGALLRVERRKTSAGRSISPYEIMGAS